MTEKDAGFTLIEMLVGLLVLSFAAVALSTTLSSAFSSFRKIKSVNQDILDTQHLNLVLGDIGRTYFYQGQDTDISNGTRIRFEPNSLLLTQNTPGHLLVLRQASAPDQTLWESTNPIKLSVERLNMGGGNRSRRAGASKPHIVVKTLSGNDWTIKAKAPLIVSESAGCQYDIVGRRCR